jgi:predicted sulfurtransferase
VELIDCRNFYEWDIGSFPTALLPRTRQFSEFPAAADEVIQNTDINIFTHPTTFENLPQI